MTINPITLPFTITVRGNPGVPSEWTHQVVKQRITKAVQNETGIALRYVFVCYENHVLDYGYLKFRSSEDRATFASHFKNTDCYLDVDKQIAISYCPVKMENEEGKLVDDEITKTNRNDVNRFPITLTANNSTITNSTPLSLPDTVNPSVLPFPRVNNPLVLPSKVPYNPTLQPSVLPMNGISPSFNLPLGQIPPSSQNIAPPPTTTRVGLIGNNIGTILPTQLSVGSTVNAPNLPYQLSSSTFPSVSSLPSNFQSQTSNADSLRQIPGQGINFTNNHSNINSLDNNQIQNSNQLFLPPPSSAIQAPPLKGLITTNINQNNSILLPPPQSLSAPISQPVSQSLILPQNINQPQTILKPQLHIPAQVQPQQSNQQSSLKSLPLSTSQTNSGYLSPSLSIDSVPVHLSSPATLSSANSQTVSDKSNTFSSKSSSTLTSSNLLNDLSQSQASVLHPSKSFSSLNHVSSSNNTISSSGSSSPSPNTDNSYNKVPSQPSTPDLSSSQFSEKKNYQQLRASASEFHSKTSQPMFSATSNIATTSNSYNSSLNNMNNNNCAPYPINYPSNTFTSLEGINNNYGTYVTSDTSNNYRNPLVNSNNLSSSIKTVDNVVSNSDKQLNILQNTNNKDNDTENNKVDVNNKDNLHVNKSETLDVISNQSKFNDSDSVHNSLSKSLSFDKQIITSQNEIENSSTESSKDSNEDSAILDSFSMSSAESSFVTITGSESLDSVTSLNKNNSHVSARAGIIYGKETPNENRIQNSDKKNNDYFSYPLNSEKSNNYNSLLSSGTDIDNIINGNENNSTEHNSFSKTSIKSYDQSCNKSFNINSKERGNSVPELLGNVLNNTNNNSITALDVIENTNFYPESSGNDKKQNERSLINLDGNDESTINKKDTELSSEETDELDYSSSVYNNFRHSQSPSYNNSYNTGSLSSPSITNNYIFGKRSLSKSPPTTINNSSSDNDYGLIHDYSFEDILRNLSFPSTHLSNNPTDYYDSIQRIISQLSPSIEKEDDNCYRIEGKKLYSLIHYAKIGISCEDYHKHNRISNEYAVDPLHGINDALYNSFDHTNNFDNNYHNNSDGINQSISSTSFGIGNENIKDINSSSYWGNYPFSQKNKYNDNGINDKDHFKFPYIKSDSPNSEMKKMSESSNPNLTAENIYHSNSTTVISKEENEQEEGEKRIIGENIPYDNSYSESERSNSFTQSCSSFSLGESDDSSSSFFFSHQSKSMFSNSYDEGNSDYNNDEKDNTIGNSSSFIMDSKHAEGSNPVLLQES